MERPIGIIGLGLVGTALAGRLLHAGKPIIGYDVAEPRRSALRELGGDPKPSSGEVAAACDRLILSLPTTDVVESVIAEIEAQMRPGLMIVDTTTGEPQRTAALGAKLAARGVNYLDATLVGSSAQIGRGEAVVIAGGEADVFSQCEDLFASLAHYWYHVGTWGSGARMKLVVNLVLGLNRAALAEGLSLARQWELDPQLTLDVLRSGAAHSRVMDTKGDKMIREDFTPEARLAQHLKDVRLILAAGQQLGAHLPLSRLHLELLERVEAAGFGDADNSAIIKAFQLPGRTN